MPADFDRCVRRGGQVRTIKPNKETYIHVCYPTDGGAPIRGEVKKVKK